MKYTALQRSDLIRAEYQAEIAIYDPSMLVFVDESGTDQRNATRHFGYALRGYSPRSFIISSLVEEKDYLLLLPSVFLNCCVISCMNKMWMVILSTYLFREPSCRHCCHLMDIIRTEWS